MAAKKIAGQAAQFPLNTVGPKGAHAFAGVGKVFFYGTTGLVGTAYGIPGLTATRLVTGCYQLYFDKERSVDIIPGVECPTGVHYDVHVGDVNAYSGMAKLYFSRTFGGGGSGAHAPTGAYRAQNPASGTVANLFMFMSRKPY